MKSVRLARLSLYLGAFSNSMAFTIIFPFGSLLVQKFGMADSRSTTGYWVGLLAFAMMLSRMCMAPLWGNLCDSWGRRPVAIISISAALVFSLMFGLSLNYWWALASRFLIGGLCCMTLVGNIVISELTRSDPGAMALTVVSWQLGNIFGNIVGGFFVNPAQSGLCDWWVFSEFPFLLPNMLVAVFSLFSLIMIVFLVPETYKPVLKQASRSYAGLLRDKTIVTQSALAFL